MAFIKDKKAGLRTVGDVIAALQQFPSEMPVCAEFSDAVMVFREEPTKGEHYDHPKGRITINGDDGDDEF